MKRCFPNECKLTDSNVALSCMLKNIWFIRIQIPEVLTAPCGKAFAFPFTDNPKAGQIMFPRMTDYSLSVDNSSPPCYIEYILKVQ